MCQMINDYECPTKFIENNVASSPNGRSVNTVRKAAEVRYELTDVQCCLSSTVTGD